MKFNEGYTLVELLVAMALSTLIVLAIVPLNNVSSVAINHQQRIGQSISSLQKGFAVLDQQIQLAGLKGCLIFQKFIDNSHAEFTPFDKNGTIVWLNGYSKNQWYANHLDIADPFISSDHDALHLQFVDLNQPIDSIKLKKYPQRIIYRTNCAKAQINRANQFKYDDDYHYYPMQSIVFYLKDSGNELTLYRQFYSKNGRLIREPLINNINDLIIAYGERDSNKRIDFKPANRVDNWQEIVGVYIQLSMTIGEKDHLLSTIVELNNLNLNDEKL